jgi:hypothetical protein
MRGDPPETLVSGREGDWRGAVKMTTEHQTTQEEKAYERMIEENKDMLSEAIRTILSEAETEAYKFNLCRNYAYQPQEYDEAIEKMRLAAVELTDDECRLLSKLWHAALAAGASICADDFESLAGYRVYSGNLHRYYRMVSGMIERTLQVKEAEELRKRFAERGPIDDWEIPF